MESERKKIDEDGSPLRQHLQMVCGKTKVKTTRKPPVKKLPLLPPPPSKEPTTEPKKESESVNMKKKLNQR